MINKIISNFYSNTRFSSDNEVALFRKFALAIQAESSATFIDETHGGGVCNVNFTSPTNKSETCEISDLLILSYSQLSNEWRATFWQAKKQGVSKWINVAQDGSQLDFKGQFNQWDLLSRRPDVTGVKGFHPPKDILSGFSSPSIGTYGVFYEKGGCIELAHSIAEFISCPSPATKSPTLAINGYLSKYSMYEHEMINTLTLKGFLEGLFDFKIGAKLNSKDSTHRWLLERVRGKLKSQEKLPFVNHLDHIEEFLNHDVSDIIEFDDFSAGLSILLVNTDGEKSPNKAFKSDS
ncbi:hypothetical protein [Vibrio salinus]|uniref:hypothetical protein n=1 Tax=Vibrio salinus TaxID=2899784 RepID=UPI001E30D293|nr:hypothetical protein [Vibrio salinus]MCE0495178.1 hypothetical protein [Vibrio salinus]